ncbi:MAG: dienelactone hydrolase family protein, partial [Deltaproteobacteria bacterium]|nr:dienelactone hydrolase family protein [Deltaproteobacteria bacterium]
FGGFEEAAAVLGLLDPKIPVVVASFDYPFDPPRRFEFPESLQFAPQAKRAVRETLVGINELVSALKKRGDVDPTRIFIVGASFGAPFAVAAAAENHDLAGLAVVHGFGDVPDTVQAILETKWAPKLHFLARPLAWALSHGAWAFLQAPAPEEEARKLGAGQRVLMVTAEDDTIVPRKNVDALWDAIKSSKASHQRIDLPGDHLRPGATDLIARIQKLVSEWIEKTQPTADGVK